MIAELQLYITDLIKNRKKGLLPSIGKGFLFALSLPYKAIIKTRNWAFDRGLLPKAKLQDNVIISVGNITVGGTGKTPFTLMLARSFMPFTKVAILSRGYRAANKTKDSRVLSQGFGPIYSAEECGDEAFLMATNLPEAVVVVGRDRCKSAELTKKFGSRLLILDDGLQHRRLGRDLELVMVHADKPFGSGHFLPRGFLRDDPKSLSRADLVIGNGIHTQSQYDELKKQLRKYTSAPLVGIKMQFFTSQPIAGKRVGVFSGIAHPEQFHRDVSDAGAVIVAERHFPDHFNYKAHSLDAFMHECASKGAEMMVCTEKDWVKVMNFPQKALPIVWASTIPEITVGQEHWKTFMVRSKDLCKNKLDDSTAPKPRA